jgi:transcriptional regulator with XRE-family HTH domain
MGENSKRGELQLTKIRINERLRELRIKSGYTQSQIAKILNVDRSTYSYYEIGKTTPDVSALITLAKIFNISISELLADESNPYPVADNRTKREYVSGKKTPAIFMNYHHRKKSLWDFLELTPMKRKQSCWNI